jgi:hypothetical protein
MLNYFEYLEEKKVYDTRPVFVQDIEDICSKNKKEFHNIEKARDRSNTSFFANNNFINQFKKSIDLSGEKKMSFNENSGMKIPRNNPMSIMNNFNKFDDPNLNLNPIELAFNPITFDSQQK